MSLKEYTHLACLFAQVQRCRLSYIALLSAFGSALPLNKYAALSWYILFRKAPKA